MTYDQRHTPQAQAGAQLQLTEAQAATPFGAQSSAVQQSAELIAAHTDATSGNAATVQHAPSDRGAKVSPHVARLHLYAKVDVAEMTLEHLEQGHVGHTWVALEWKDPSAVPEDIHAAHRPLLQSGGAYADPFGFWPAEGYETNVLSSYVKGVLLQPDTAYQGSEQASQTWDLTQAEAESVIEYAESKRDAEYSVYFYNCTTFGKEAVEAAGKSPPSMCDVNVCMPNTLYEGIKERQDDRQGQTRTHDLETGASVEAYHPDTRSKI
ncbi:MAG: hypothetical protein ACE366_22695 [Bradymonadia bacterium]